MAALSAAIDETCTFELGDEVPHLLRHEIIVEYLVASGPGAIGRRPTVRNAASLRSVCTLGLSGEQVG